MKEFTLVICWLGVIQSALLGTFFLSRSRQNKSNLLLGLILVMTSIRVGKSTLYLFSDPSVFLINVGFAAHAFTAPLFLFYIRSLNEKFEWNVLAALQLLPGLGVLVMAPYLTAYNFWYIGGYSTLLYYTLIYLLAGWSSYLWTNRPFTFKPVILLFITLSVFQLAYFSNYILGLTDYSTGPMLHAVMIFLISFLVLRDNSAFNFIRKRKYQNLHLSEKDVTLSAEKITQAMSQKPYLKTDFSLATLSELTGLPSHVLSYVLNEGMKLNFLQFINSHRVEEAKKMLLDHSKDHLSIAGIAYDCGFNTLSSFNQAFKKVTGMTPSVYKKQNETRVTA